MCRCQKIEDCQCSTLIQGSSTSSKNSNSSQKTGFKLYLIQQSQVNSPLLCLVVRLTIPEGTILWSCNVDDLPRLSAFLISTLQSSLNRMSIESGLFEALLSELTKRS